nr:MAG TPA: GRB2-binding adapter (GAPT) [Caudoviricetes sp.]
MAYLLGFGGVWRWGRRKRLKTLSQLSIPKRLACVSSKRPSCPSNTPTRASAHRLCAKPGR